MAAPPEDNQGQNPPSPTNFSPQYQPGGQSGSFVPPSQEEVSVFQAPSQQLTPPQPDLSPQPISQNPNPIGASVPQAQSPDLTPVAPPETGGKKASA